MAGREEHTTVYKIPTLGEIRDKLLMASSKESPEAPKRADYVNGVLDMYNAVVDREDLLRKEKK